MSSLNSSRYEELLVQLEKLNAEIEAERMTVVHDAIATCTALITKYDLSAFDLGLVKTQQAKTMAVKQSEKTFPVAVKRAPKPPKYINPETGKTWNGNGPAPSWMVGNRDDYLIAEMREQPKGPPSTRATQNNGSGKHA
jgi:DNA-binding protein H-NS